MPQLPRAYRSEAEKQNSSDGEIKLFEFTHPSLAEPIRVANRRKDLLSVDPPRYSVISNGVTYESIAISDVWPDDVKDAPPKASITLDNIASGMAKIARSISGAQAAVSIKIVMHSAPDVAVGQFDDLKIRSASGDENSVTFHLSAETDLMEPTGRLATKDNNPGLFGVRSA